MSFITRHIPRYSLGFLFLILAFYRFPQPLLAQGRTGTVSGVIFDSKTGRPVAGAAFSVNGVTSNSQQTDSGGRFSISLSPGKYALKFTHPNYADIELSSVDVVAGETFDASTVMSNKSAVTSVDVVEKVNAVGATADAILQERRLSAVVSDSISRQELAEGVGSDAASALEKVTGVSVVGEGFVYVRGLGERYSSTQLNGALIPTTEPEKRVVPLDLFPSGLIESVKIAKTYSPDLPGEFAGGLVQLQTVEFPTQRTFNVSMKSGYNSVTTLNRFLTYPGGGILDFFGFDNGSRSLPSQIPANARLFPGRFTSAELQALGRSFSNNWEPRDFRSMRPPMDVSASGGGTFGRIGLVGAVAFSNQPQTHNELQRYLRQGAGSPVIFTEYPDYREYVEQARLGAVFNAAFRVNANHKFIFRNTLTHDTEKSAREFAGRDGGVDSNINSQRLRWVERNLLSTGVEGDHSLPRLKSSLLHWQFTYSKSNRDEPDLREVFRGLLPNGRYIFSSFGSSGVRFFSDLSDRIYEPQVDYSIPFFKGKISGLFKSGFRATIRSRDFQARRFRFIPQQLTTLDLFLPSNLLFGPGNIRPSGFQITEFTRGTDKYAASMDIYAGYSMVDLAVGSRWRFVGGARIEDANQIVTTIDNLVPGSRPVVAQLQNRDPIPAINAIYAVSAKTNIRASYSRTLSRPDFRELSPFDFNNTLGGFVTQGNANLKRATINNADLRWEHFSGGNQVIAASVFVKTFNNPIEQTILPANDLRQTFVNAQGARNVGFELEFRRALGSFSRKLREFAVSSNFTFVDSQIDISPADAALLTSKSRPLLGQSRYIANAAMEWARPKWRSSARLYSNWVSRRIADVGTFGLPDIYQEGNTMLDAVYQFSFDERKRWNLRIEAENLLDNHYHWTQGNFLQRSYRLGRTVQAGVSWTVF